MKSAFWKNSRKIWGATSLCGRQANWSKLILLSLTTFNSWYRHQYGMLWINQLGTSLNLWTSLSKYAFAYNCLCGLKGITCSCTHFGLQSGKHYMSLNVFWNFVIWFFNTRDLISKFLGNIVCEDVLKCMSCVARIGLCRAVCYVSVRTKEFLSKVLASTGNQIREQVCIENCAKRVQCVKGNTESFSKYPLRE